MGLFELVLVKLKQQDPTEIPCRVIIIGKIHIGILRRQHKFGAIMRKIASLVAFSENLTGNTAILTWFSGKQHGSLVWFIAAALTYGVWTIDLNSLLLCTWFLKNWVWKIKWDELDFYCLCSLQNSSSSSWNLQTRFFKNQVQINRGSGTTVATWLNSLRKIFFSISGPSFLFSNRQYVIILFFWKSIDRLQGFF